MGMLRVRNEELILKDTLDHISQFVDAIVLFDDKSSDNSVSIAKNHPAVATIIQNRIWRKNRTWEETANRAVLLNISKKLKPDWLFYADADERFIGDIRTTLKSLDKTVWGIRITLFDAYMTSRDKKPYSGGELLNFRKEFGPEHRDILMIWRNNDHARYILADSREPTGICDENITTKFLCQHYGKSLSSEQWESTCDYYINNFPQYAEKWSLRKGKSIHEKSDFNTPLYSWDELVDNPSVWLKIN